MKTPTIRKTTKTELNRAVEGFLHFHSMLTGGTRAETLAQAPSNISTMEAKAAKIAEMVANPNKAAASDDHLMDYATRMVAIKLENYRSYLPAETPSNVIQFA